MILLPLLLAQAALSTTTPPSEPASPAAPAAIAAETSFHLVCRGAGQNQVMTYSSGVGFFGALGAAFGSHSQVNNFEDEFRIDIEGASATATIPGRFVAPIHLKKTNFEIKPLQITADEISGKLVVNWANHPNIRVNRRTGVLEMDGSLGNYSGKCQKSDPNQRAF